MRSRSTRAWLASLLVFLCGAAPPAAAAPALLTHHGYLSQSGVPIDGTLPVVFALYDGQSEALPLWSEGLSVAFS